MSGAGQLVLCQLVPKSTRTQYQVVPREDRSSLKYDGTDGTTNKGKRVHTDSHHNGHNKMTFAVSYV